MAEEDQVAEEEEAEGEEVAAEIKAELSTGAKRLNLIVMTMMMVSSAFFGASNFGLMARYFFDPNIVNRIHFVCFLQRLQPQRGNEKTPMVLQQRLPKLKMDLSHKVTATTFLL